MEFPFDPMWLERLSAPRRRKVIELLCSLNHDYERDFSDAPILRFLRETTISQRVDLYRTYVRTHRYYGKPRGGRRVYTPTHEVSHASL